jgi:hypothetical protein
MKKNYFNFFQYVEYFIDRGPLGVSKDVCHLVLQNNGPDVEPGCSWKFESDRGGVKNSEPFKLRIPVVPPTLVGVCRLIQIYYLLKVSVSII